VVSFAISMGTKVEANIIEIAQETSPQDEETEESKKPLEAKDSKDDRR
jgi:hypothetical protein